MDSEYKNEVVKVMGNYINSLLQEKKELVKYLVNEQQKYIDKLEKDVSRYKLKYELEKANNDVDFLKKRINELEAKDKIKSMHISKLKRKNELLSEVNRSLKIRLNRYEHN